MLKAAIQKVLLVITGNGYGLKVVGFDAVVGDFVVWIQRKNPTIGVHRLLCLPRIFESLSQV